MIRRLAMISILFAIICSIVLIHRCLDLSSSPRIQKEDGALAEGLTVQIDSIENFSETNKEKVEQAAAAMESALNSEEFHSRVSGFTWQGKQSFADNRGMSNDQIYAAIMSGRETYSTDDDHTVNLNLILYRPPFYKKWSVVGYGYPGTPQIYVNRYYLAAMSIADLAGLLAHEWCHKLGFNHDFRRTLKRPYSVPYGVGSIVSDIAKALDGTTRSVVLN